MYAELTLPLFVSGYLAMLDAMKTSPMKLMLKQLTELMLDMELSGWEVVRGYHVISLQKLENGRADWTDSKTKLECRRVLVWHSVHQDSKARPQLTVVNIGKP